LYGSPARRYGHNCTKRRSVILADAPSMWCWII
jgi:hypothetical protein